MNILNCPICGSIPSTEYTKDKTIIQCNNCNDRGFTIKVENSSYEKAIEIWNKRELFLDILNNFKYFSDVVTLYNGDIENNQKRKQIQDNLLFYKFNNLFYLNGIKNIEGWIITPRGKVLLCQDAHEVTLARFLNLEDSFNKEEALEKSIEKGYSRITVFGKCLIIQARFNTLNIKILNAIYDTLLRNRETYLKDIIQWCFADESIDYFKTIYNFNEFLEFINETTNKIKYSTSL